MDTIVGQQCAARGAGAAAGLSQGRQRRSGGARRCQPHRCAKARSWRCSGRSGSGKSTLLRIVAGLLTPTAGEVLWRGQPVHGPGRGVAMVFQSFALFPWLTVQENVELGLEARGVPARETRKRAPRPRST